MRIFFCFFLWRNFIIVFFIPFIFILATLSCASKGIKGLKSPALKIKGIMFDEKGNLVFSASDVKEIFICPNSEKDSVEEDICESIKVNSLLSTYSFEISKPKNHFRIKILMVGFGGEKRSFIADFNEKKIIENSGK